MTPYEIEVMMWYYTRAGDHPHVSDNPPIWRPTMNTFVNLNMLMPGHNEQCYEITERGKAYCEHLCAVQIPICKWTQPS